MLAIKEHLIDELDYILVPTEGWNKLVSWYGLTEGQEPIARKVSVQSCPLLLWMKWKDWAAVGFLWLEAITSGVRSLELKEIDVEVIELAQSHLWSVCKCSLKY